MTNLSHSLTLFDIGYKELGRPLGMRYSAFQSELVGAAAALFPSFLIPVLIYIIGQKWSGTPWQFPVSEGFVLHFPWPLSLGEKVVSLQTVYSSVGPGGCTQDSGHPDQKSGALSTRPTCVGIPGHTRQRGKKSIIKTREKKKTSYPSNTCRVLRPMYPFGNPISLENGSFMTNG